ncbi:hypothetical protein [Acetobacterium woodii]|uniref:Uncharacterized protein n=1 Tax=Acetobacterium woodii (strain ATCC 29683 / DSM 1030 / JCM 2381 / KCTC 1655 / WB1) TaxID=931626 RepID=H6LH68_ACEWD|nr:hypothetical protein [Acetobacterium woodii]AFA48406.1 hypothetical protein Awo_c16240 [Acetobacterium woodii DSM 1030]
MTTTFYGNQGVVNSIILDMEADFEKQLEFLNTIKFTDDFKPEWLPDIVKISFIAEPALGQFGKPNLIIIAEEKSLQRHVIFIESKISAYDDASEKLNIKLFPNNYKGISAKLNIRLALMYRLAKAYHHQNDGGFIEDLDEARKLYHDVPKVLKKPALIKLCIDQFGYNPDFLFVALTNDPAEIQPFKNANFFPPIGVSGWRAAKQSFGLISFEMLEKQKLVNPQKGYYALAKNNILHLPAEAGASNNDPTVRTIVLDQWDPELKLNLEEFLVSLGDRLTTSKVITFNGSYSIKAEDGRTLVKLFADKEKIYITLRNDNIPEIFKNKPRIKIGVGLNAKSFVLIYSGTDDLTGDRYNKFAMELIEIIVDFVEL